MAASPWDGNWGLGGPADAAPAVANDPWVNPQFGMYEGGNGGDPRDPGNHQGIGDWRAAINRAYGPGDAIQLLQQNGFKPGGMNFSGDVRHKLHFEPKNLK